MDKKEPLKLENRDETLKNSKESTETKDSKRPAWFKILVIGHIVLGFTLLICTILMIITKVLNRKMLFLVTGVNVWAGGFIILSGFICLCTFQRVVHRNQVLMSFFNAICAISSITGAITNCTVIRETSSCRSTLSSVTSSVTIGCEFYTLFRVVLVSSIVIPIISFLSSICLCIISASGCYMNDCKGRNRGVMIDSIQATLDVEAESLLTDMSHDVSVWRR